MSGARGREDAPPRASSWPALLFSTAWLLLLVIDNELRLSNAGHCAVYLLGISASFGSLLRWRAHFVFGLWARLLFVPTVGYAVFIIYAFSVAGLQPHFVSPDFFILKPLLSWPSLIGSLIVALTAVPLAYGMLQRAALLPTMLGAGLAAALAASVHALPILHPVADSLLMFAIVAAAAAAVHHFGGRGSS